MTARRISLWLPLLVTLGGMAFLQWGVTRPDLDENARFLTFTFPGILYAVLTAAYLWLMSRKWEAGEHRIALGFGVILRVMLVFAIPQFSDDFFRFIWDGKMMSLGINPYDLTPSQAMAEGIVPARWRSLYDSLNSKDYYTVYPPVLQGWFWLSAVLAPDSLLGQVIVLKLGVVMAEILSILFLGKLASHFKFSPKVTLLYALNPLVITELTGNLHFEAWMICFTLGALWMLVRGKLWPGAMLLALAVGSKLLPLVFVPFLLPRLGWKKMAFFSLLLGAFVALIFLPMVNMERWQHISQSLQLYFRYFEFNPGPQAWLRRLAGEENKELFLTRFPQVVGGILLLSMLLDRNRSWPRLAGTWLMALGFYQLTSSTVHPWYVAPLVALGALGGYRWPMLWAIWLLFTYSFYYRPGFQPPTWFLQAEYGSVMGLALIEWIFTSRGRTLEEWLWRNRLFRQIFRSSIPHRLRIKEGRIAGLLNTGEKLIDIGCGNGGLAHALVGRGFRVTPVDVKDISFFEDVNPVLYDGSRLPFKDKEFDTALLITVLHHTPDPDAILREAVRVSSRIVVMEDVHRNALQKHLTFFTDSLVNMEFSGHPHTNRSDAEWLETFARLGWRVTHREQFRSLLFFTQVIYVVEPKR